MSRRLRRVAVLDDYQRVAATSADWDSLDADVTFFDRHVASSDELVAAVGEFDVVVLMRERTPLPARILHRLPRLQLIVTTGMRNAAVDIEAARAAGVVVCGTRFTLTDTAELTWALILGAARHVVAEDASVRSGEWQTTVGTGLHGLRLGLLGLGRVGQQVAAVGRVFGMDVVAWSENLTTESAARHGVERVDLPDLLRTSDVVSVHLQLSERTHGLLGREQLALMKPESLLVNTSRGPIVEENALVRALEDGVIGGAGLDVFDQEPLPPDHPLRAIPGVVLTPHIGYVTRQAYRVFYHDAVEDIRAYMAGNAIRVL